MDAFGILKPEIEIVHDLEDNTLVTVSGEYDPDFYRGLDVHDSDVVLLRQPALGTEVEDFLEQGPQFALLREEDYSLYIAGDVGEDFPSLKPHTIDGFVREESLRELVEQYSQLEAGPEEEYIP